MHAAAVIIFLCLVSASNVMGRRTKHQGSMSQAKTLAAKTQTPPEQIGPNEYYLAVWNPEPGWSGWAGKGPIVVPLWCANFGYFMKAQELIQYNAAHSCIKVTCNDNALDFTVFEGCGDGGKVFQHIQSPSHVQPDIKITLPFRMGWVKEVKGGSIEQYNGRSRWDVVAGPSDLEPDAGRGYYVRNIRQGRNYHLASKTLWSRQTTHEVLPPSQRCWPDYQSPKCDQAARMQTIIDNKQPLINYLEAQAEADRLSACAEYMDCHVGCSRKPCQAQLTTGVLNPLKADCTESKRLLTLLPEFRLDDGR